MNNETDAAGAVLPNGDASAMVPVMGIEPVATASTGEVVQKPKKKKRKRKPQPKKVAKVRGVDPILAEQQAEAAGPRNVSAAEEASPPPTEERGGEDFNPVDRRERFRGPVRRESLGAPSSIAPTQEFVAAALRVGRFDRHIVIGALVAIVVIGAALPWI